MCEEGIKTQGVRRWAPLPAVGAAALGVFVWTLAPTVTAEDSGELITAAWHFGIPHPPGYPLWTLLCGAFMRLAPIGSIAYRANLFSAVCTAGAAVVLFAALCELRLSAPAAAGAALVWVWSRWSWAQAVITEVYGLNALLTAGIVWCGFRWYRARSRRLLLLASCLLGLGMSNHHTIALAGLAVAVWIALHEPALLRRGRLVAACLGLFAVGMLPYAYIPVRAAADPVMNWGDPSTAERFWQHVSRDQYGALGPMAVENPRSIERFGSQVAYLATSVSDDLTWVLTAAAGAGLVLMWVRRRSLALFVVLWLLSTGVLFVLLANYDSDRTSRWAMRVFLIPVSLGLTVSLACVLDTFGAFLARCISSRTVSTALAAIACLAAPAWQLASHWRQCDYSDYWYAHDHARNMLRCLLPRAMVFPCGDHTTFPLVYLHAVEGQRPDIVITDMYGYLRPELLANKPPNSPDGDEAWLVKSARRPVYYATKRRLPVKAARFVQAGILYHLLPDGMPFDDARLLSECAYRNLNRPSLVDFGASHILCDHAFFTGLADLGEGKTEAALDHFDRAAAYGEGIKEVFNNIGSALAEHGQTRHAVRYFRRAAALDRRYALPRWNLFRAASTLRDWEMARRALAEIIAATPDDARAHGEMGFLLANRMGAADEAIPHWRESLRHNPNQPQIIDALNRTESADPAH